MKHQVNKKVKGQREVCKCNSSIFFFFLFSNGQKAKLRSIFRYYDYLDNDNALDGKLIISRQVLYSMLCCLVNTS